MRRSRDCPPTGRLRGADDLTFDANLDRGDPWQFENFRVTYEYERPGSFLSTRRLPSDPSHADRPRCARNRPIG